MPPVTPSTVKSSDQIKSQAASIGFGSGFRVFGFLGFLGFRVSDVGFRVLLDTLKLQTKPAPIAPKPEASSTMETPRPKARRFLNQL